MKIKSLRLLYLVIFLPVFTFNIPAANAAPACGSGKNAYLLSVGSPVGSRQFAVACIEHDACYDILGKSKGECDKAFHNRMLGICSRDHNTWFGRPLRIACNGRADAFYSAVRAGGGTAYSTAQDDARKELPSAPALAASNYQRFRLQTGTALHETGNEFDFGVLPNGDVVAIKKSGTGSGKTEVHILSAASNYQSFRLQTGTALHETGNEFAFGVLPNSDVVAIKKSGTGSGKTEVHILSLQ